jgi:23S rRNA (adenine2503-C2)-methyltransferase
MKSNLKQLSRQELSLFMEKLGQKSYRTNQIMNWLYKKPVLSFDEMSDLPADFREKLKMIAEVSSLNLLSIQSSIDGTHKFLFELEDGETIESVIIPNNRGEQNFTLCLSSQVGCAVGCKFCTTGILGLKRNLKAYEIIDQLVAVKRCIAQEPIDISPASATGSTGGAVRNIVFMGMGEPFNNFHEVSRALENITGMMNFSKRKITLSTAGIIPGIIKLGESGLGVNLAISLNATTDDIRSRIMPINRTYPLKKLIQACREFPLPPNRRITFEYVLLGGINDAREDAQRLVKLLSRIRSKVNLIPYNSPHDSTELKQPSERRIQEFQNVLRKAGMTVIIRKSMGADISAACGQLKAAHR